MVGDESSPNQTSTVQDHCGFPSARIRWYLLSASAISYIDGKCSWLCENSHLWYLAQHQIWCCITWKCVPGGDMQVMIQLVFTHNRRWDFFFPDTRPLLFFRSKKRRVEKVLQVSIALTSKQSNPSSLRGLLRHITHGARAALLNRTTHVCTCTKIKSIYFRPTRPDQAPAPCHSPISPIGKKESHAGHDRIGIILVISAGMRSRVWTLAAVADRRRDGRLLYLTYLT